jgi:hypothetical protein
MALMASTVFVQLDSRRKELAAARTDGSEASGAASKARRRALQDCEVAEAEYNTEMGTRQAEYDAALTAHNELLANIKVCIIHSIIHSLRGGGSKPVSGNGWPSHAHTCVPVCIASM